jgi:Holliday junction resolvasome RuvABC endonuclease subunit
VIRIVGCDPGYAHFGIGTLEREGKLWRHVDSQHVYTKPDYGGVDERCRPIWTSLSQMTGEIYAYESQDSVLAAKHVTGNRNASSDYVRDVVGLIRARAYSCNAALVSVTPSEIRRAFGLQAGATKEQVAQMLRKLVSGIPTKLALHVTDALAVAVAGERKWNMQRALMRRTDLVPTGGVP